MISITWSGKHLRTEFLELVLVAETLDLFSSDIVFVEDVRVSLLVDQGVSVEPPCSWSNEDCAEECTAENLSWGVAFKEASSSSDKGGSVQVIEEHWASVGLVVMSEVVEDELIGECNSTSEGGISTKYCRQESDTFPRIPSRASGSHEFLHFE